MSTSTKQGPVKLSISQISSRDLVQILLHGSGNQSEINGIQEFLSQSSLLLKSTSHGALVPLVPLQTWLQTAGTLHSTHRNTQMGRNDNSQAPTQHRIPAEWENALLPSPKIPQNSKIRTLAEKCRCNENLGAEPLAGFFQNLAKRCGLFISCEIQTTLSTILRKWIDVKWYLRICPVAKLPHQHRQISRKSFLQTPWLPWYNINLEVWNHWHDSRAWNTLLHVELVRKEQVLIQVITLNAVT